ncbi:hypothetical protein [Sciscionella marina]|uniref:hypothetical protein n=1 Tax=Sciscionella marina TaxID=508770 RepID=UPI00037C7681|nr:hypothetical protein [Sciscionella marina]
MRPTIDEQLDGAIRLLRLAEDIPETTPAVTELVRNARRLVERTAGSWSMALPFLQADNARTAALLGYHDPDSGDLEEATPGTADLAAAVAHNEKLRAALTHRIRGLPDGPDRATIGTHLRARVDADPT